MNDDAKREELSDEDGENLAVRAFLLLYGGRSLRVGQMQEHLRKSGFDGRWPEWVDRERDHHLTKGGAQEWLRHLFALAAPASAGEAISRLADLLDGVNDPETRRDACAAARDFLARVEPEKAKP